MTKPLDFLAGRAHNHFVDGAKRPAPNPKTTTMLTAASASEYVTDFFKDEESFALVGSVWFEENDPICRVPFTLAGQEYDMAVWVSDDGAPHLYGEW